MLELQTNPRAPRAAKTVRCQAGLALMIAAVLLAPAAAFAAEAAGQQGFGADWESWKAHNSVSDLASLQRGARDFLSYCNGCHALKYMRYSRIGVDLEIPPDMVAKLLVPSGGKATDYISTPMPAADAVSWFGKEPPDLSLIARARGTDYLYQYLTTFYIDPARPTGANNLALPASAMPDVLSHLEGLKRAVFRQEQLNGTTQEVFDHFETVVPGSMTRAQFDDFVRDIVNFLDYVGEPVQAHRRALGVWVVGFLLVFTWLAWLLKKEYWKDVH
ncbi:MAG TPA: cytochrome c1 [Steroidobacteraceae bacterium]|nr:cytochrome c1 [Steroidobacteraceae bacterium]